MNRNQWCNYQKGFRYGRYDEIKKITFTIAAITRKNVSCLVTAGKHVKYIRTIAKQQPRRTIQQLLEAVFSVGSALKLYIPGNKHKSYKMVKMQIFATLDKAKFDTGNIRGLILAAVKHTTVQMTRLSL
jgi:hypothetical protein